MKDLNEQQEKAILSSSPAVAIIAGPGTGKTKTLVSKIEYLLSTGVPAERILALTFTNKAAHEMKNRLQASGRRKLPFVGTFHAFALHLLNIEPKFITKKQQLKDFSQKQLNQISKDKNNFTDSELVARYNDKLKSLDLIDYDDLLIQLYDDLPDIDMEYILIDEFQDTSPLQYKILQKLDAEKYFVIGDPKQSIYSFRATQNNIFDVFQKEFDAELFVLTRNYRSTQKLINTFESLFPENKNKLCSEDKTNSEVYLMVTSNEYSEADWITQTIKSRSGGVDLRDASDALSNYSDFVVIYRTHKFKKIIEKKFRESAIPYQIVGGGSIFEDEEIQNIIERLDTNNSNEIGLIDQINKISENFQVAKDKRQDLKSVVHRFGNDKLSTSKFLAYIDNLKQAEYYDPNVNCVTLLTMHASKGLEFESVFVCGLEQGIIPHTRADIEEEKRLLYVAMSRAKKALYLTKAGHRYGKPTSPSQFLGFLDIEKAEDKISKEKQDRIKKYKLKKAQRGLF